MTPTRSSWGCSRPAGSAAAASSRGASREPALRFRRALGHGTLQAAGRARGAAPDRAGDLAQPDGRVNAAPFSFFNVFAEEPPLVVLGLISPLGGAKDTTLNIRDTGEFVVNLVDEPIAEAMNLCAIDFPPEISEIEVAGFDLVPSAAVAPPRIGQAPVALECRRYLTLQPARERYLVIGEVLVAHVRTGFSIRRRCASIATPTRRSDACSAAATCAPMTASR